jgi:uncharacterized protein YjiS (DUF1127 family)
MPGINAIRFTDCVGVTKCAATTGFQEVSMSASHFVAAPARRASAGGLFGSVMRQVRNGVALAWRKRKTRRMLADMDERMLADLGISRAQASFEASRWMWD